MRPRIIVALVIICIISIVFVVVACNRRLTTTYYHIDALDMSTPLKIAILTDLHSTDYGDDILNVIKQEEPDMVFLVGDIFDNHYDNAPSWTLVESLISKYPCYYVTGNHEMVHPELEDVLQRLYDAGVHVLQGQSYNIEHEGKMIRICGVDDKSKILECCKQTQIHYQRHKQTRKAYFGSVIVFVDNKTRKIVDCC